MKPLIIKATENSPQIIFKPDEAAFSISGQSRPEDAWKLYDTVLKWLEKYTESVKKTKSPKHIKVEFSLLYFNTVSAKYIFEILRTFALCHSKETEVKIVWHYKEKDEDIKESGEEFARLVKLPFDFVAV